jgi:hypothetical protein
MSHLMRALEGRPKLAAAVMEVDVDPAEASSLPDSAFAWAEKRAFPLHSREHAILSRTYLDAAPGVPEHVRTSIKEALDVYGVNEAIFARPAVTKVARDTSDDYLLPDTKRLRVTDAEGVKLAEQRLRYEGRQLSPGSRTLASARLVEKAAFHGVRVSDETKKMAGLVVTQTRTLADWLEARAEAAPSDFKDGYTKLAKEVLRQGDEIRDRNVQEKIAQTLEELDEIAGLAQHWSRKLPDPAATVWNSTKVASPGMTLGGRFIPMERLAAYPMSFYSDAMGPDIANEIGDLSGNVDLSRLAQVLPTLPLDIQRHLATYIR